MRDRSLALVGRHRTERLQERGHGSALASAGDAHSLERSFVGCRRNIGEQLLFQSCDVRTWDTIPWRSWPEVRPSRLGTRRAHLIGMRS